MFQSLGRVDFFLGFTTLFWEKNVSYHIIACVLFYLRDKKITYLLFLLFQKMQGYSGIVGVYCITT